MGYGCKDCDEGPRTSCALLFGMDSTVGGASGGGCHVAMLLLLLLAGARGGVDMADGGIGGCQGSLSNAMFGGKAGA